MRPSVTPSNSCGMQTTTPSPSLRSFSLATRLLTLPSRLVSKAKALFVSSQISYHDLSSRECSIVTVTQVVNSTDPTYFYCGVPSHCQKGMFGIINPPSALSSSTSIFNSMTTLAANVNSTFFVVMVFLLFFPESRPLRDGLLHKSVDSQQQQGCQLGKQYRLGQIA
jgi:hypothetical protein